MHLKSLTISNFRKFGTTNNTIDFVGSNGGHTNLVSSSSTLIVGKNNAGKTTATKALEKILDSGNLIVGNDFNFTYLNKFLKNRLTPSPTQINATPELIFKVLINVNAESNDLITNLIPFMKLGDVLDFLYDDSEVAEAGEAGEAGEEIVVVNEDKPDGFDLSITIKYEIKESPLFEKQFVELISKYKSKPPLLFNKFIELIDNTAFMAVYYGIDGEPVEKNSFRLSDLVETQIISANKKLHDTSNLSKVFNKIIHYRYKQEKAKKDFEELSGEIEEINEKISKKLTTSHDESINNVLSKIESSDRLGVKLSSDLTFDKVMNNLVKYEYTEQKLQIPEGQFGLGYSNLMSIIGEIIDYVERYPQEDEQSKISLICIEEPETHMHPQMQELFIKNINDAIIYLIDNSKKTLNCQLIITTHSSHILNSKIHSSNSFDNINYITCINNNSEVVRLNDHAVSSVDKYVENADETEALFNKRKLDDLKFLKKHIKYKVSELFFSDAVIFVEGLTEETLIPFYIDNHPDLKKYYISVFNINGAHGQVYYPLIKLLKIPSLIITDLDIKRSDEEKFTVNDENEKTEIFSQVSNLNDRISTNSTIHKFNGKTSAGLSRYIESDNLFGVFQKDPINKYYATSFEEAFILTNSDNTILNKALKQVKKNIYNEIVGSASVDLTQLIEHSYKLQNKLSANKSDFASTLLYEMIISDSDATPILPSYITDGFDWLRDKIIEMLKSEEAK
jgi:predicted ATP-dependent endonuclease of OLD family